MGESWIWQKPTIQPIPTPFKLKYLDYYWRSLAWQCYRNALPIHKKLSRHGVPITLTCSRCRQDHETVLHALVQCSVLSSLIIYVEHLLYLGRIQLSSESIIKGVSPTRLTMESEACFLCIAVILKECVWRTRMQGLATGSFVSGPYFFKYHLKCKIGLEKTPVAKYVWEAMNGYGAKSRCN